LFQVFPAQTVSQKPVIICKLQEVFIFYPGGTLSAPHLDEAINRPGAIIVRHARLIICKIPQKYLFLPGGGSSLQRSGCL